MVAIHVVWTVRNPRVVYIVVAVIVIGMGEGIVGKKLETVRQAFFNFDLY